MGRSSGSFINAYKSAILDWMSASGAYPGEDARADFVRPLQLEEMTSVLENDNLRVRVSRSLAPRARSAEMHPSSAPCR